MTRTNRRGLWAPSRRIFWQAAVSALSLFEPFQSLVYALHQCEEMRRLRTLQFIEQCQCLFEAVDQTG